MAAQPIVRSPTVLASRPGTPFSHRLRVEGSGPFRFSGSMPGGLSLDPDQGVIQGRTASPGEYSLSVLVENEGSSTRWDARLVVGDRLALTPPMGWMSWNAFGPDLDERVVLANADAMVRLGLREAGYEYVCLDDHWHGERDAAGRLTASPSRFPRGIRSLADQVHARGLKLGIYTCAGTRTCGGEPGSEGFEETDAATFAEWEVDYVKDDYCHAPPGREAAIERYTRMGEALATCGRSIVFAACEWGERAPWEWAPLVRASLWRCGPDIQDAWDGAGGIGEVLDQTEPLAEWGGPGSWNDPDMLVAGLRGNSRPGAAGTRGCTDAEYRTQISMWAMLAAPLHASCDLRFADRATRAMLTNSNVIAIDQDPLGVPAHRVMRIGPLELWQRPLTGGASAVAIVNRSEASTSVQIEWPSDHGGLPEILNCWTGEVVDRPVARTSFEPHGTGLFRLDRELPAATAGAEITILGA
jgi:alpha-galactosidase